MPRRIRWGLLLLVVVAFVAPGAGRADAAVRHGARAGYLQRASAVGPVFPTISQAIVRQGVDLDDARRDKVDGGLRRFVVGAGSSILPPAPGAWRGGPADWVGLPRRPARSSVGLRAPPSFTS